MKNKETFVLQDHHKVDEIKFYNWEKFSGSFYNVEYLWETQVFYFELKTSKYIFHCDFERLFVNGFNVNFFRLLPFLRLGFH